ncbi:hypothetical protein POM88_018100 [Heracleum sosnowskyi]|uniref:Uncharacterized protein n=1 Tax=Heracleum sosnowskyi TaxID=360622 RepID=A0AAD8IT21_9APIA|nr:hypothetical protein POM88_018100 [Heracleum sosnowskyi]
MEGSAEVRSNKTLILKMEYDTFRIRKGEGITDVYLRFSQLVLDLNLRGVTLPTVETNTRYLRNQPKSIEHRVYAIRETRDLHTTSLEEYYGILKTYELETLQDQTWDNDSKGKETASGLVADEEESKKAMVAAKPKSSPAPHQVDNDDECTYNNEEDVTHVANFALMAETSEEPEVPVLTLKVEMSIDDYKEQNGALSEEIYMLCKSLDSSQKEQKTLVAKCRMLEAKVEELEAACTVDTSLRDFIKSLEHKLILKEEIEACLRNNLAELEIKCEAYKLAASKVYVDNDTFKKITGVGVGLDYSDLSKKEGKRPVDTSSSDLKEEIPRILKSAVKPIYKHLVPRIEEEETELIVRYEIEMENRQEVQPITPIKQVKINFPREESRPGLGAKAVKQQGKKGIKELT